MAIRNLIFDWSGTLADDLPPVVEATNAVFVAHGKPPFTIEEFKDKFYLPFTQFYEEFLPEATLPELEEVFHRTFTRLGHDVPLLPGAREILDHARECGMKVFLLSTVRPDHWERQVSPYGLRDHFTHAYTGIVDKRKTIHDLLLTHELDPAETIFVGDMRHDIETAHHGGVLSCAVLTGYESLDKLRSVQPDLIFRDLFGLLDWLRRGGEVRRARPVPTVGALVFNERGEALFVRTAKWSGLWGIPGGKIELGETAVDALRRELLEECALAIDDIRFVLHQDCIDHPEFHQPAHFILLNYTARTTGGPVRLNDEAQEHRWMPLDRALAELPLNGPTRVLVTHVHRP
jgi:phosphoglycolate phosphatase-like HAD superfamily hydrolase/ADP-ribose pyrophosphatase YjhB (NUDIX family)